MRPHPPWHARAGSLASPPPGPGPGPGPGPRHPPPRGGVEAGRSAPAGAAAEHVGGEAGLQAGQGERGTGGPASGGQLPAPRLGAVLSGRPLSRPQPPIQVYGLEGRYATALYSAATKQKKLDQVEKELGRVWVSCSTAYVHLSWHTGVWEQRGSSAASCWEGGGLSSCKL